MGKSGPGSPLGATRPVWSWWGFYPLSAAWSPHRNRGAKISLVPVLPAHCPTLKKATKCPEEKPQAPTKQADSHGFLSSLCSSSPPSAKQKQHLPPCLAKHFGICTAEQGEGGVFTFLERGSSIYTQNNTASAQNSRAQGAVADAAGSRK